MTFAGLLSVGTVVATAAAAHDPAPGDIEAVAHEHVDQQPASSDEEPLPPPADYKALLTCPPGSGVMSISSAVVVPLGGKVGPDAGPLPSKELGIAGANQLLDFSNVDRSKVGLVTEDNSRIRDDGRFEAKVTDRAGNVVAYMTAIAVDGKWTLSSAEVCQ